MASTVLLLHNIVPHFHHGEIGEAEHHVQHEDASTALDLLFLSFHEDLGQGHLECMEEAEQSDLTLPPIYTGAGDYTLVVFPVLAETVSETNSESAIKFSLDIGYISSYYLSFVPLRAPPFCA